MKKSEFIMILYEINGREVPSDNTLNVFANEFQKIQQNVFLVAFNRLKLKQFYKNTNIIGVFLDECEKVKLTVDLIGFYETESIRLKENKENVLKEKIKKIKVDSIFLKCDETMKKAWLQEIKTKHEESFLDSQEKIKKELEILKSSIELPSSPCKSLNNNI